MGCRPCSAMPPGGQVDFRQGAHRCMAPHTRGFTHISAPSARAPSFFSHLCCAGFHLKAALPASADFSLTSCCACVLMRLAWSAGGLARCTNEHGVDLKCISMEPCPLCREYTSEIGHAFLGALHHISPCLVWPCSPKYCPLEALLLQNIIQVIFLSDRILLILLSGVVSHRGRVAPQVLAELSRHMCRWHASACKPF